MGLRLFLWLAAAFVAAEPPDASGSGGTPPSESPSPKPSRSPTYVVEGGGEFPGGVSCDVSWGVGVEVNGVLSSLSSEWEVVFFRGGSVVPCGSSYVPGEVLAFGASDGVASDLVLLELSGGSFVEEAAAFPSGNASCGASRAFVLNASFVAPSDGSSVVVGTAGRASSAGAEAFVTYSCLLTPGTPVPTASPTYGPTTQFAPTYAPTAECRDRPSWHKKDAPAKHCDWVGAFPEGRCTVVGDDGALARDACEASCGCSTPPTLAPSLTVAPSYEPTSFAPTYSPTFCNNSATWHKVSAPSKDCDWVAKNPTVRCETIGEDDGVKGPWGHESCRFSCGCTAPPTALPTVSTKPTLEPTTAAPSLSPSPAPSATPTTHAPTVVPSYAPSSVPTYSPSFAPTSSPKPTSTPTYCPTPSPTGTSAPTPTPSLSPSIGPSGLPSGMPSPMPTPIPSPVPTELFEIPAAVADDDDDGGPDGGPSSSDEDEGGPDGGPSSSDGTGPDPDDKGLPTGDEGDWWTRGSHDHCANVCGGLSCDAYSPATCSQASALGCQCAGCSCAHYNATVDDDIVADDGALVGALDDVWTAGGDGPDVQRQPTFTRDPWCIDNNFRDDATDECAAFGSDAACCGAYALEGACLDEFAEGGRYAGYCARTCGSCGGSWTTFATPGASQDTYMPDVNKDTILARIAFLTYVATLLMSLVITPCFWCNCRKRYRSHMDEWRCHVCHVPHVGRDAHYKRCVNCGARRHFGSKQKTYVAPYYEPMGFMFLVVFGAILAVGGAVTLIGGAAVEATTEDMVELADMYMYATGESAWDEKGLTMRAGLHMALDYNDYGNMRLHVAATRVVLAYENDYYERPIGYVDVPKLKLDPGDRVELDLPLVFEFRTDDFWGTTILNEVLTKSPEIKIGPSVMEVKGSYNGDGSTTVNWILGDSDLDMAFNFGCAARANMTQIDMTDVTKGTASSDWFDIDHCSNVPHEDSIHSRIRAFQWTCVICGAFLVVLAQVVFEVRLNEHEQRQRALVKRPRRNSFKVKVDSSTMCDPPEPILLPSRPGYDEEAADRDFLGLGTAKEESKTEAPRTPTDGAETLNVEDLSRTLADKMAVDVTHCDTPTQIFAELLRNSGGGYIDRKELALLLRDNALKSPSASGITPRPSQGIELVSPPMASVAKKMFAAQADDDDSN